jgi:hypothetical protein
MVKHFVMLAGVAVIGLGVVTCRQKDAAADHDSKTSLPPVYSLGPESSTNWDPSAGAIMLVALSDAGDSAAVVLPDVTDSTLESSSLPPTPQVLFDLYGRSGKIGSSTIGPLRKFVGDSTCEVWPSVDVSSTHPGWQVALAKGSAGAIPLDSIEALSSADSASLAASLVESVAALPPASDPTFRRLPFRVRYAYTTQIDTAEIAVADIVRALNEEANPRIEHIFLVGERPKASKGKFAIRYYSRAAGAEETTQATEVLAALEVGSSRRAAFVVNVESDNRARFGLIERTGPAQWRPVWWSGYTGC